MSENKKRNLSEIINDLSKNVMFRLSLGSKELFHSNFWAWLLEEYGNKATKIFQETCDNDICDVCREMSHTDLSFKSNGNLIIIENKFKSYPYLEQLQRYAYENFNRGFDHIILVSYFEPTFLSANGISKLSDNLYEYKGNYEYKNKNVELSFKFKYLSYSDILIKLKDFCQKVSPEHKKYVDDYIWMLQSLIELKDYLSMENNPEKQFKSFLEEINSITKLAEKFNFSVTIKKIFCNNLLTSILKNLDNTLCWGACDYASRAKHVYMDVFLKTQNQKYMKDMGLQLVCSENGTMRKYIHVNKENQTDIRNKIDIDNEYKWFFNNTCGGKKKKFLGYEYENDAWLYRTCESDNYDINNLNYANLLKLYKSEIKMIEDNCQK